MSSNMRGAVRFDAYMRQQVRLSAAGEREGDIKAVSR